MKLGSFKSSLLKPSTFIFEKQSNFSYEIIAVLAVHINNSEFFFKFNSTRIFSNIINNLLLSNVKSFFSNSLKFFPYILDNSFLKVFKYCLIIIIFDLFYFISSILPVLTFFKVSIILLLFSSIFLLLFNIDFSSSYIKGF